MKNLNRSRKLAIRLFAAALLLATASSALAAVRYVDVNSTNATPPYLSWSTAATNIQDAVDAAAAGDEIVVTNGIYATGGRATPSDGRTNRVAVDKSLNVRSVNGPQSTTIDGGHSNRCVYLTNGASLAGFTLSNGFAHSGGGVWCESTNAVVSNCVVSGNSSFGGGTYRGVGAYCCGSYRTEQTAFAGGVYGGTVNNCILNGNWAANYATPGRVCVLNTCTIASVFCPSSPCGDTFPGQGGGAANAVLNNCTLTGNSAGYGGGAFGCMLNNCTLNGNSAISGGHGGGASGSTLNNCTLTGNQADAIYRVTVDGDTVRIGGYGGGTFGSTQNNCIVYFNTAADGANFYPSSSTLNYSCTTPLPTNGVGNITNDPLFVNFAAGNYRLRADSPCIDAGTNLSASITNDLDGRPRPLDGNGDGLAAFDMGAYEYRTPLLVWQDSPNPTSPHADWASAAHTIQDAVDAAVSGDEIVVTNGIYASGWRAVHGTPNRVAVDKQLTLRSVNGPQFTIIQGHVPHPLTGDGAIRCVYLGRGASLFGFTLSNGGAYGFGGAGVFCLPQAVVSNCVIVGNVAFADLYGVRGGGASGGTLNNCTLSGNSASFDGGGAYHSTLNNCTLSGNFGGASYCTLNNCIAYFNTRGNYDSYSTVNYSCTTPQPTGGLGNITNAPLFVDQASGNLRLQSNSPCINAGQNTFAPAGLDLDGYPRIRGDTVDIGAYEFQFPVSQISYAWLQRFNLPINPATDTADLDGDGVNNYHEWLAGSDPTNPFSFPPLLTLISYRANVILTWPTNAVGFTLQSTTNLGSPAVWVTNSPAPVVIGGQNVVTNPISSSQQFFRLIQ